MNTYIVSQIARMFPRHAICLRHHFTLQPECGFVPDDWDGESMDVYSPLTLLFHPELRGELQEIGSPK